MTDPFELGKQAGREATNAPDTFEASQWSHDYALGFITGYGWRQGFCQASSSYGAHVIGELGASYGLPLADLLERVDSTLHPDVREGYGAGEGDFE